MRPVAKPFPSSAIIDTALAPALRKVDPLTLLRMQLQATVGCYCSYCEMPINVTQSVASKYARRLKRGPSISQWGELLLACDFCQEHRKHDISNLSDFLWPDSDATFSLSPTSPFLYALKDVSYVVKPDSLAGAMTDSSSTKAMVIVSANPQSPLQDKAARTIDLFQLNTPFYDAATNTFTITQSQLKSRADPRVELRTRAWITAGQAITTLQRMQALTKYPLAFDGTAKMVTALAQSNGFWSCWMTLMWQSFLDPALLRPMLLEVSKRAGYQVTGFQTLPDGGRAPWTLFTGTAVDRVKF